MQVRCTFSASRAWRPTVGAGLTRTLGLRIRIIMLIAFAHVAGTIAVLTAFGLLLLWLGKWEAERNQQRVLREFATKLGLTLAELEADENLPKVIQASSERNSNELLRNRLSDLCGIIRTLWGWLGAILQYGTIGYVLWAMFSEGRENAPIAWVAVGIAVFFWVISVVFSFACYILTGRFPGEARAARKALDLLANAT